MAIDGIVDGNRVANFGDRKLAAKVTDLVLNGVGYYARAMGQGKKFDGKTMDFNVKVSTSGAGQYYSGVENLGAALSDNNIVISFAHTAFTQPVVSSMLESFANTGAGQVINLDKYKYEEAYMEAIQTLGTDIYTSTGASKKPLGLIALVDDGSGNANIGGQLRSSYTGLQAQVTDFGTSLTLAKMATLEDDISAAGMANESPNIKITTKTIWGLYEQLLQPTVRADYQAIGYASLPLRASEMVAAGGQAKAAAGFTALSHRGTPLVKDDAATSGKMWFLNERYLGWYGRSVVPEEYRGMIEKVNLGTPSTVEGTGANTPPSEFNGWFYQPREMMPNQAGTVGRFHVIGQMIVRAPRRQGRADNISTI